MHFLAKVLTSAKTVVDVRVEAADEAEARQLVVDQGGRLLELSALNAGLQRRRRQVFNLAVFNQQMHSLLEAGQTVVDSIEILGRNDSRSASQPVYEVLLRHLRQGHQLSVAMESLPSVFPLLYVAMVRSSETTGTVRSSIQRYMRYQKQVDEIRGKLVAAITYPAVLLGVGSLVISFLMLYVLPRFASVYEDAGTMTTSSAGFVQLWGRFVRDHALLAWATVIMPLILVGFAVGHPRVRQAAYRRVVTLPLIGERLRILQLGRLYRTVGMLLDSGVSILAAMQMARDSLPGGMRSSFERAAKSVSEGRSISHSMNEAGLGTEVAERLLVAGESSGNLDEMMTRIADFYDQETATWIDTAGRLIEPALMLGIGLVVGAIVLMLYSPIFDLANVI
ncbi:MAG: type II secretion system F family protein [Telluria sp.]